MARSKSEAAPAHRWRFFRAGGVDQVRLETGADIVNLDQLDQKLWVALSCPVQGLEFDQKTLALLDADGDGRVRAPEILAAVKWLGQVLANPDDLLASADSVALASIATATAEGRTVLASARHILRHLGKAAATSISVEDSSRSTEIHKTATRNGDGIVPPDSLEDEPARAVATDLLACMGGRIDRSGAIGFDQAGLDAFFAECAAFDGWHAAAAADASRILPLDGDTAAAAAALAAVRTKVDDYFTRCRLTAFDPRARDALNRQESAYLEVAAQDLSICAREVAGFPLAVADGNQPLPLRSGLNPAWAGAIARLVATAGPLLGGGGDVLTEAQWTDLCAALAPYEAWAAAKAGAAVEGLGIARVREILESDSRRTLEAAIAADLAVAPEVDAIGAVEKLTLLHRDIFRLLHNFVNFADFYSRTPAIFQAGRLYFDARSCDLCVHVDDVARHATLASMSKAYLVYVQCTRSPGDTRWIAAAFTAGSTDNIFVGRNGLFYDRAGRDWDATVTKIIENPISIGQAFWSPYKKLLRWIEEQVAKRAAIADGSAMARLQTAAMPAGGGTAGGGTVGGGTGGMAPPKKMDIGVLAAISVAIGGVATVLGGVMQAFFGLGYLMPLGFAGLILLISGPSMVIAWLKLRQRNLGPILDANGWAVNALTKVNVPLGRSLTRVARIPAGAERSLRDPFAPAKRFWPRLLLVLLVLGAIGYGLYRTNLLHRWLPDHVPAHHEEAPPK